MSAKVEEAWAFWVKSKNRRRLSVKDICKPGRSDP